MYRIELTKEEVSFILAALDKVNYTGSNTAEMLVAVVKKLKNSEPLNKEEKK